MTFSFESFLFFCADPLSIEGPFTIREGPKIEIRERKEPPPTATANAGRDRDTKRSDWHASLQREGSGGSWSDRPAKNNSSKENGDEEFKDKH
jgi:hypothetical protein